MTLRPLTALAVLLALAACDRGGDPPEAAAPDSGPVVVYAPASAASSLTAAFDAWTAATGNPVSVRFEASDLNVDAVIARRDDPPADLLIAGDVHGIWRAGMEGALRPVPPGIAGAPGDPDGAWVALAARVAVLAYDVREFDPGEVVSYEDLGSAALAGRACVLSSANPISRTVVANMIERLGARPAELAVRGWMANLAAPPFDSEDALVAAITGGECAIGIVSRHAGADDANRTGLLRYVEPPVPAVEVIGAGVGRHAHAPERAAALLEWLVAEAALPGALRDAGLGDAAADRVAAGGWGADDAVKLAERAGYR